MTRRCLLPAVLLLASLGSAAAQSTLVLNPPAGAAARNKHVVLLSGDEEYRSEEALPMLAKILSQRHGFKATVLFPLDPNGTINPENQRSLAGSRASLNSRSPGTVCWSEQPGQRAIRPCIEAGTSSSRSHSGQWYWMA